MPFANLHALDIVKKGAHSHFQYPHQATGDMRNPHPSTLPNPTPHSCLMLVVTGLDDTICKNFIV
jgi:hypothetical protein